MKRLNHSFMRTFEEHPSLIFLLCSLFLVLVLYGRALHAPFVYDDLSQIVDNHNLQGWSSFESRFLAKPVAMNGTLLKNNGSTYRPVFYLSLYLDRNVWGLNAGAFHATNLLLHFLNGYFLFVLSQKWKLSPTAAAAVALIWLSLPVNTEVVAWVSGRAYLLCTLFIFLALLSSLKYQERGTLMWLAACFLSELAALFSLELGIVTLPLLILVNMAGGQWKTRRVWTSAGTVALAIACAEIRRAIVGVNSFTTFASVKWALLALWQYIALTLLPVHMSVDRSTSISLQESHRWWYVGLGCSALILIFTVLRHKYSPFLLRGLLWFLVAVAPYCIVITYQGIAERTVYLASIGIVIFLVTMFSLLHLHLAKYPLATRSLLICAFFWLIWNMGRTLTRVGDWTDPMRLYSNSLIATPRSASLHYNLGFTLREDGRFQESLTEYHRALGIDPKFPNAYASIGDVYLRMNAYTKAEEALQKALTQNPQDTSVLLNLGAAYQSAEDFNKAEASYRKILQIDPGNAHAYTNLGVLYITEGRTTDAMHQFAMAVDLKTTDIVPYYNLGAIFQQAGRRDLAMEFYKKVLELKPDDPDTLRNIEILEQGN